jgi:hypothetical protein
VIRRVIAAAGVVVVVLLVAEVAAVPIAERQLERTVRDQVEVETVELVGVARPVAPRLLVGRARDVEVVATGVRVGELRVAHVRVDAARVVLAWAPLQDAAADAVVSFEATEADLEQALVATGPGWWEPDLQLTSDGARLGDRRLGVSVPLRIEVTDASVRISPDAGRPTWWETLGLVEEIGVPDGVRVTDLRVGPSRVTGTAAVTTSLERAAGAGPGRPPVGVAS